MDTDEPLIQLLQDEYGLTASVSRLAGENDNYLVVDRDGAKFVYKVAEEGRSREQLELEYRLVEALVEAGVDLELPRIVPTLRGEIESAARPPHGAGMRGRLVRFVEGTPWHDTIPSSPELRRDLGCRLAQVTRALESFDHPAAHRTHRWDLTAVGRLAGHLRWIDEPARRSVFRRALMLYRACAQVALEPLPHAVIHGDWNDENVLVSDGRVRGLLDFGDCLYNPRICELAIAVTYTVLDEHDPLSAAATIVGAYHAVCPLTVAELEVLFPLICGRLTASVAIAAERRRIDRQRSAWFVHEERAWQALERFLDLGLAEATLQLGVETDLEPFAERGRPSGDLLADRRRRFAPALSISYDEPLKIIRGRGQYLHDESGRPYIDLYNNVCHVGHCHPRVVAAGSRQMARLNTNTRYLYDGLTEYADRLCDKLPEPLAFCFFVNSGSEANELALRLARTYTDAEDLLVVEGAYHGHTTTMIDISPYKFLSTGGAGVAKSWVHVVPVADGYRGPHKGQGRAAGQAYADQVGEVLAALDRPAAGFICESLLSCGGQVIPPEGYLERAYTHVRRAGGLCIADEVQVGFGRVGSRFWGFELQDVVPDIVVMGKPIGNGHPMSAVVTTAEIARSFAATGMEFFSTFGGNPVSCAIGMAVLDVIEEERLQENARVVGGRMLEGLTSLMDRHSLIGDVRGVGLFLGVELVRDRATLEPAAEEAQWLVNELRRRQILLGTEGIHGNVIKIKPPMVISPEDADYVVAQFDEALAGLAADRPSRR